MDAAWEQSLDFVHRTESVEAKYRERLEKLRQLAVKAGFQQAGELQSSMSDMDERINEAEAELQNLQDSLDRVRSSLQSAQDAENKEEVRHLEEQEKSAESEIDRARQNLEALKGSKSNLQEQIQSALEYSVMVERLRVELSSDLLMLNERLSAALDKIGEAQKANDRLKAERDAMSPETSPETRTAADAARSILYVYPMEEFSSHKTGIAKIGALFNGLSGGWSNADWISPDGSSPFALKLDGIAAARNDFISLQSAKESERKDRNRQLNERTVQTKQKLESTIEQVKHITAGCVNNRFLYEELLQKENRYLHGDPGDGAGEEMTTEEQTIRKQSFQLWSSVMERLTEFRDDLYMTEFVLTRFNYRTMNQSDELFDPMHHPLRNQEAEYVLYGRSSCSANYAFAYGEMYMLMFALRTTEALMDPKLQSLQLGSPLLVLLAASAEGATEALADMKKLTEGRQIALWRKTPQWSVGYKDLLRIFFMLHGNGASRTARVQALVDLNTGENLSEAFTYVQGTAESSVRLWLTPQWIQKGLNLMDIGCEVREGRCRIAKTAALAYER